MTTMLTAGQSSFYSWIRDVKIQTRILNSPTCLIHAFGHLPALLLSQCMYWTEKAPDHSLRDGWFYKRHEEWMSELVFTEWEFRQSMGALKKAGVVETKIKKVGIAPITHYRINIKNLQKVLLEKFQLLPGEPLPLESENPSESVSEDSSDSYIGKMSGLDEQGASANPEFQFPSIPEEVMPPKVITTAAKVVRNIKVASELPITSKKKTSNGFMAELWRQSVPKFHAASVKCMPVLTNKQVHQLGMVGTAWAGSASKTLLYVVEHWLDAAKHVKKMEGLKAIPLAPSIDFLQKHQWWLKQFYLTEHEGKSYTSAPVAINCTPVKSGKLVFRGKVAMKVELAADESLMKDKFAEVAEESPMSMAELLQWKAKKG